MIPMTSSGGNSLLVRIPEWFVMVAALTYGTGFLIVSTFFNSFGLRDIGAEFFRVRYAYIGFEFILLPVLLVLTPLGFLMMMSARPSRPAEPFADRQPDTGPAIAPKPSGSPQNASSDLTTRRAHFDAKYLAPGLAITLALLLAFITIYLFAPPNFLRDREWVVALLFGIAIGGLAASWWLVTTLIKERLQPRAAIAVRWTLCAVTVTLLGYYSLRGIFGLLWEMLRHNGYYFLVFLALILFITRRSITQTDKSDSVAFRMGVWAVAGCLIAALYYLSVLTFALRIFPYIPAAKGGGDYSRGGDVVVMFDPSAIKSIPKDLLEDSHDNPSRPLKVIESTEQSMFFADPTDAGGPEAWRRGDSAPKIFEVRRALISGISYDLP